LATQSVTEAGQSFCASAIRSGMRSTPTRFSGCAPYSGPRSQDHFSSAIS
jgi:hypothetical protein